MSRRLAATSRPAACALAALVVLGLAGMSPAQDATPPPASAPATPATPAPTPAATPIPASDIAAGAEDVAGLARRAERLVEPDPAIEDVRGRLADLAALIDARRADTSQMIGDGGQLHALDHLARSWYTVRSKLARASEVVNARVTAIDELLREADERRAVWTATRASAVAAKDPRAILDRIDEALATLRRVQQEIGRARADGLDLQGRIASELFDVDSALSQISDARMARVGSLFRRDSRPIWSLDLGPRARGEIVPRVRDLLAFDLVELRDYVTSNTAALACQVLLFLVLCALFRKARAKTADWIEADPDVERKTRVFQAPYSAALVLTLTAVQLLLPQLPWILAQATALAGLLPVVRIIRLVATPDVRPAIWAVAAFFVADRVRDLLSPVPQVEQLVLFGELLVCVALLAWLVSRHSERARRLRDALRIPYPHLIARTALVVLTLALVAVATGTIQLARLLATAVFAGVYVAAGLYVAVRAAESLVALAVRVRPFRRLRMVQRHRILIEQRARRLLMVAAVVLWAVGVLQNLALDQIVLASIQNALALPVAPKGWSVTLGDVLATAFVVWLAFALSRLIRFTLEEDVYPRVELPRGIPYAISTLLHYAILVGGFVLGLGAIGLDPNRFTILAGAFGVGIGFGLQNVVNNFVSGLILIFERPVQVGDAVQIGNVTGEVRRIGIRSCTVRTGEGADVIVPNGNLISGQVTNWTFADRTRRIDVQVGVSYDADPERVLALLRDVGRRHPAAMKDPEPTALFLRFGESSLDFELQVWTNRFEMTPQIRSDLGVSVLRALREAGIEIPFPQRQLHLDVPAPTGDGARDVEAARPPPATRRLPT
ncbi:MAG TPA: mechanosensitive ion channel domain-containing protein [Candidatus Binatia bacterium]|nr:mechanosensitive ion channel domain-containing protein [Candidatus Binatia bacterium]